MTKSSGQVAAVRKMNSLYQSRSLAAKTHRGRGKGGKKEGCREVNYWDRELGSTAERGMPRWTMIQWNECVILSKGVSTYSDSLEVAPRRLVLSRERDGSLSVYNVFRIMAGLLNYLFFSFFTQMFVLFLFSLGIRGSVIS